jgi:hypothetical protein
VAETTQPTVERPAPEAVAANLGPGIRVADSGWAGWRVDLPAELADLLAPPVLVSAVCYPQ